MKTLIKYILNCLYFMGISLLLTCVACKSSKKSNEKDSDSLKILKKYEKLNANQLDIPDRKIPFAYINRNINLSLVAKINIAEEKADMDYSITNNSENALVLSLKNPLLSTDSFILNLPVKEKVTKKISNKITIKKISANTNYTMIRPYLQVKEGSNRQRMLMGKYSANIEIQLPEGAKIAKSSIPFQIQKNNIAVFSIKDIDVLPVIQIWYTIAAENIALSKEIIKGSDYTVRLTVTNNGTFAVNGIKLSSEFPRSIYNEVDYSSDGSFKLLDGEMFQWSYVLDNLGPHQNKTVSFKITPENTGVQNKIPQIIVHNKSGDLILVK
jgi:hypothetical protein